MVVRYGLRNPQELAFDEFGNLFSGDNDRYNGDSSWRNAHQSAPLGAAEVWMSEGSWKVCQDNNAKFPIPPVCNIEDGPSGFAALDIIACSIIAPSADAST